MSSLEGRQVIVVGAGPGGIAAAILCARAAARVTLLDAGPGPDVDAGVVLRPDALAILHALGLGDRLSPRGRRVTRRRIANARDRTLRDHAFSRGAGHLDHALVVRRRDLDAAMMELVAMEPRIDRRTDAHVQEVRVDGSLTYTMPRAISAASADLIVAADGVRSRVRTRAGMSALVEEPWWYVRGIGPALPRLTAVTEYWTRLGVFGMAPLDHGTSFYAATHAAPVIGLLRSRNLERFREAWIEALGIPAPILASVTTCNRLQVGRLPYVDCPSWSAGRVVLLGDAAHAGAPSLMHGASSAVVDAYVLGSELTRCTSQTEALRRYEQRRRLAAVAARRQTTRLVQLANATHPAVRWLREGMMHVVGRWSAGDASLHELARCDDGADRSRSGIASRSARPHDGFTVAGSPP